MGSDKVLFKCQETKTAEETAAFLSQMAERIKQGSLVLRQGEEEMEVGFAGTFGFEAKMEEKTKKERTKYKLEIELEWVQTPDLSRLEIS